MNKSLIFVTTGTQLPFDRLISQVNDWAFGDNSVQVVAQTAKSDKTYKNITTFDFLSPEEYEEYVNKAKVIIGHAGMGTVITGFENNKPLILMARKYEFGEHRNDHQQSTIDKFIDTKGIYVANDENQLAELLGKFETLEPAELNSFIRRDNLIKHLSNVINGDLR